MWAAGCTLLCFDRFGSFTSFLWALPCFSFDSYEYCQAAICTPGCDETYVCVCLKSFRLETYGRLTYVGEKDGNISLQKCNSWQPRGYFPYTLLERGSFFPGMYFPPHKNKKSSFVGFTVSMTLCLCPHKSTTTHWFIYLLAKSVKWIKGILAGNLAEIWLDNFAAL